MSSDGLKPNIIFCRTMFNLQAFNIILTIYCTIDTASGTPNDHTPKFDDFTKKYEMRTITEEMDRRRSMSRTKSSLDETNQEIYNKLDPTDELMAFEVSGGDSDILKRTDTRRWKALKHKVYPDKSDRFGVRIRLIELMKQAIYQARKKMTIMQKFRTKYKNHSVYKMGFLFSRTDFMTKQFFQISIMSLRLCTLKPLEQSTKFPLRELMKLNQRQLHRWFEITLLVDLIKLNNKNLESVMRARTKERLKYWQFVD